MFGRFGVSKFFRSLFQASSAHATPSAIAGPRTPVLTINDSPKGRDMPENNECVLYQRWRDAQTDDERLEAEEQLFRAILKHAAAVIWQQLHEFNDALALNIAGDAVTRLSSFEGRSEISTWVHAIAKKQATQEKRLRARYRKVFNCNAVVTDIPLGPNEVQEPAQRECPDDWVALMRFRANLPEQSVRLLDGILAGKDQNVLADELGISAEAAQSRRRRLLVKLNTFLGI